MFFPPPETETETSVVLANLEQDPKWLYAAVHGQEQSRSRMYSSPGRALCAPDVEQLLPSENHRN